MISTLCVLLLILWIGNYFIIHNDIIYMQYMYILYKNLTVNANIYMQVWFVKIILWDIQIQHFHTLRKEKFILKYKIAILYCSCMLYLFAELPLQFYWLALKTSYVCKNKCFFLYFKRNFFLIYMLGVSGSSKDFSRKRNWLDGISLITFLMLQMFTGTN